MATKKTAAKKPTVKKAIVKKAPKRAAVKSFRVSRPQSPFFTIAITRQTLYWGIIAGIVLIFGLWIVHLQNKVNDIYDAIDATAIETSVEPVKKKNQ